MATFQQRLIKLEHEFAKVKKSGLGAGLTTTVSTTSSLKFGAVGEDAVAAENRDFDTTGFNWQVTADSDGSYLGLYATGSTQRQFFAQATAPDAGGAYSYIDVRSNNGGSAIIDLWMQNNDGSLWAEYYGTPYGLYMAGANIYMETINSVATIEFDENQSNTEQSFLKLELLAAPSTVSNYLRFGSNDLDLYLEFSGGSLWSEVTLDASGIFLGVGDGQYISTDGIVDGTVEKSLGLDSSGNIVTGSGGGGGDTYKTSYKSYAGGDGSGSFSASIDFLEVPLQGGGKITVFEQMFTMSGGSTDYQLAFNIGIDTAGQGAPNGPYNIVVDYYPYLNGVLSTVPVISHHITDSNGIAWGTTVVLDTLPDYVNSYGGVFKIRGSVVNLYPNTCTYQFTFRTYLGYASSQMGINQGGYSKYSSHTPDFV